jgi:hypothetical protein
MSPPPPESRKRSIVAEFGLMLDDFVLVLMTITKF